MYINHLSIKNFRNFGDPPFEIELKPFTLILGENNIGKTNLLNALSLIFSQEITVYRTRILQIDDFNFNSVKHFKEDIVREDIPAENVIFPEVKIDVNLTDLNIKQMGAGANWPTPGDSEINNISITYLFSPRNSFNQKEWIELTRDRVRLIPESDRFGSIDFPIGEYRYVIYGGGDPSNKCDYYFLNMFRMDLLDALRDAQSELIASGNSRLLYRILNQRDFSKYEDIKSVLLSLEGKIGSNENLENIRSEVEKLLQSVSLQTREDENKVGFRFTSPEISEILRKLSMQYGSNPVDVARNGLGRNNLLFICLVLSHLSAIDIQNNEVVFRLIAVEEPEAHLHPHLQDHIAENIEEIQVSSEGSMQLILTSHSNNIAAKMNLENSAILFLDEDSNNLNYHYILSNLDQEKEKKTIGYIKKFIDTTNSRMFFSRKIILVEGISENILIPLFYKLIHDERIEKIGCNVINVRGLAFSHFLKIVKNGYFIKCVVFTDSDVGTRTEERAEDLKDTFDDSKLIKIQISKEHTFEADIIAANSSGSGREIIEKVIKVTRPIKGPTLVDEFSGNDLDVERYFEAISAYKSEFAYNLAISLAEKSEGFVIPEYIVEGFGFLR